MTEKALKLALEALDNLMYWDNGKPDYDEAREAITAIKAVLSAHEALMSFQDGAQPALASEQPSRSDIKPPNAKDFEDYCKTLHPLWNTRISRTEAEGFFHAGWLAAHGIKGEA